MPDGPVELVGDDTVDGHVRALVEFVSDGTMCHHAVW
jgi:hypothetical protein